MGINATWKRDGFCRTVWMLPPFLPHACFQFPCQSGHRRTAGSALNSEGERNRQFGFHFLLTPCIWTSVFWHFRWKIPSQSESQSLYNAGKGNWKYILRQREPQFPFCHENLMSLQFCNRLFPVREKKKKQFRLLPTFFFFFFKLSQAFFFLLLL